ncbi:MAG: hypothetical protein RLY93_07990 [Sumerlaeia bacterium]
MAQTLAENRPRNVGELLLLEGRITQEQYEEAADLSLRSGHRLYHVLAQMKGVSEEDVFEVLRKRADFPLVELGAKTRPTHEAAMLVSRDQCRRYGAVPLYVEGGYLILAMEDPTDMRAVGAVESLAVFSVRPVLAHPREIREAIDQLPEAEVKPSNKREVSGLLERAVLLLIWGLPIAGGFTLLLTNDELKATYHELDLDTFERILFFTLGWTGWAIVSYWITDIIFGIGRKKD